MMPCLLLCAFLIPPTSAQEPSSFRQNKIIVGTELDYPPYSFLDKNNHPAGLNIDLTLAIAEVMELDVEIRIGPWNEIRDALHSGEIDVIAGMYYSPERDEQVDFSPPFARIHHSAFARDDTPDIQSEEELRGKTLIVMRGDIMHDDIMEKHLSNDLIVTDTQAQALHLLAAGRGDFVLAARLPGLFWIRTLHLRNLKCVGPLLHPSDYCFAVNEGNNALLGHFVDGMSVVKTMGRFKEITDQWLGVLEPWSIFKWEIIQYAVYALLFALLLAIAATLWIRSLKRMVAARTEALDNEIREHLHDKERIEHLNRILLAIRNVNQLITKEKYPARLLQKTCELLIETRGYYRSMILVCDQENNLREMYSSGFNSDSERMLAQLRAGKFPHCVQACFSRQEVCVMENPAIECPDCVYSTLHEKSSSISAPLQYNHDVYGALVVTVPNRFARDSQEHELLREIADDVAFVLHSIQTQIRHESLEKKFADVMKTTSDAVIASDLDGLITAWNPGAENLYGYPHEDILGKSIRTLIPQQLHKQHASMLEQVLKTGSIQGFETERIHRDGRSIPVELTVNLQLDPQSRPIGYVGIQRDITERKLAEIERERLLSAIEQAAEIIVITGVDGTIQYVNPAFEQITGYSRQEVIGNNPRILKSGKQDEVFYKNLWDTIVNGNIWQGRLINKKKDGVLYTEEATISPVRDASGVIVNFVAAKRDITREIQLEDQLRHSQKMEAIGALAGGIAHDFNNMLMVILGYGKMALSQLPQDDPIYHDLREIYKAGERAASLTNQLLAFSRKQITQPEIMDLNRLLHDFEKMLRRMLGEDIDIRIIAQPDLGNIKADPGQIDQVIMNLAVNARDAMPQGGKFVLETKNVELDRDYAESHLEVESGKYVLLACSDTGCGIAKDIQAKIFDPFFTTKKTGKGTGLGLSTVYGIVKQNGGNITVYSELDKGTTFKIYFPRIDEDIADSPKESAQMENLQGSETILIVEDEKNVRRYVEKTLSLNGYSVFTASCRDEAIIRCNEMQSPIDLLLTDVVLPQSSGKVIADALLQRQPNLKVIFMSGYTDNAIVHHNVLDENVNFLQKPFTPDVLLKKVRSVLGR
jgi:PAS domain S-box-containing protein